MCMHKLVPAMHILTDLCAHGQPRTEAEDTHQHRELLPVRPQEAGPVVHEAGHQGLHVAELRVHPEDLEDKDIKDLRSITGQRLVGTSSMMKKMAAQKKEAGRERTSSG